MSRRASGWWIASALCLLGFGEVRGQVVIRGPYLQLAGPSSVLVRWRTDLPTDSAVRIAPVGGNFGSPITVTGSTTEHSVLVSGLSAETEFAYEIGHSAGTLLAGPNQRFKTSPPQGARRPLRAWILGDSGTANSAARRVRDAYLNHSQGLPTDLILMLGDNAYSIGTDAQYQVAVFDIYNSLLPSCPLWPALGNHDASSTLTAFGAESGPYYDIFDLPAAGGFGGLPSGTEGYYAFDWGNVHFVCLNSSQWDLPYLQNMAAWLQADLAATTQEWVVTFWHHPPYSKGSHDSDTEGAMVLMRQYFLPILESGGVDLVLTGHSHSFERSFLLDGHYGVSSTLVPATMAKDSGNGRISEDGAYLKPGAGLTPREGAVHVVAGSSGQISGGRLNHPVMIRNLDELGSCVLEVWGTQLDLRFLDDTGTVADHFTITKGSSTPSPREVHRLIGPPPDSRAVGRGETWRYLDTGIDPGPTWKDPSFSDSVWLPGRAPLGFGDPGLATTVSFGIDPAAVHPTTYFRRRFTLGPDLSSLTAIRLNIDYDDAFVAWLNGVEVARSPHLPAGPIGQTTLAMVNHEHGPEEAFDITAFLPLLVTGNNVLAIEVHQGTAISTDLWLEARLDLIAPRMQWRRDDSNVDLGTAWVQPAFDDSAWAVATLPAGTGMVGQNSALSTVAPMQAPNTVYFRRPFSVPFDLTTIARLRLHIDYDDAFVAWLNGVEVARRNLPAGPIVFGTQASAPRSGGTREVLDLSPFIGLLQAPGNALAIEIHQAAGSEATATLDAWLDLETAPRSFLTSAATGGIRDVNLEPESVLFVNGSDGGLGRSVDLAVNTPFSVRLESPSLQVGSPAYALAYNGGTPTAAETILLSPATGDLVFNPFGPSALILASTFPSLPGLFPSSPLPWTVTAPSGLPVPLEFTLQGIVVVGPGATRTTNALRVRILP